MSLLDLEFMRLALATGAVVGVLAPAVGFFLVQRQHEPDRRRGRPRRLRRRGRRLPVRDLAGRHRAWRRWPARSGSNGCGAPIGGAGDQALALFFYGGIALGVVFVSAAEELNANLFTFLFGSILTVTGATSFWSHVGPRRAASRSSPLPRARRGCDRRGGSTGERDPGRRCSTCLAALVGLTIALSMRIVGIPLIAALMALPVMTATRLANSLESASPVDGHRPGLGAGRPVLSIT